jgi:hypothetical protein
VLGVLVGAAAELVVASPPVDVEALDPALDTSPAEDEPPDASVAEGEPLDASPAEDKAPDASPAEDKVLDASPAEDELGVALASGVAAVGCVATDWPLRAG